MNEEQATILGQRAYEEGRPCVPMMDAQIVEAIKHNHVGNPTTIKLFKAFVAGFTNAADAEWRAAQ